MSQGTLFRDPALCGHATGDGEQTIGKIPNEKAVSFFNGLACSKASARNTCNVSVVSSILIRSTKRKAEGCNLPISVSSVG